MGKMILPYGKEKIEVQIEDVHLAGVLRSGIHGYRPAKSAVELVRESIENPVGSPRLRELAARQPLAWRLPVRRRRGVRNARRWPPRRRPHKKRGAFPAPRAIHQVELNGKRRTGK